MGPWLEGCKDRIIFFTLFRNLYYVYKPAGKARAGVHLIAVLSSELTLHTNLAYKRQDPLPDFDEADTFTSLRFRGVAADLPGKSKDDSQ